MHAFQISLFTVKVEEKVFEIPTGCKSVMQLGTARTEEHNLKFIQLQL